MKIKQVLNLLILLLLPTLNSISFAQIIINGKIIEENGNPIANARISIKNSDFVNSNSEGEFQVSLPQKPIMPFKVNVEKKAFRVKEFEFADASNSIEIILEKINLQENAPSVKSTEAPGKSTDPNLKSPETATSTGSESNNEIENLSNQTTKGIRANRHDSSSRGHSKQWYYNISEEELKSYRRDLIKIAEEIITEKARLEETNNLVNSQIKDITDRLKNEKYLSLEQRESLKVELAELEEAVKENSLALQKAQEKTHDLITQLRKIIVQKDSINMVAKQKLKQVEKEKSIAVQKNKSNLFIFSIITLSLLFLASLFYLIIIRIKKQKKQLELVNKELKEVKDELIINVEEVSKQKEQIEAKNRQMDSFVYKASHDIKGPLRSVIGLTQVGLKSIQDQPALEIFDHILKSTQKLDNLLMDLLKLSKAQQNEVSKTTICLKPMVEEILSSLQHLTEYERMKFNISIDSELSLYSDERILYSIIQNFIENAIKYKDPTKEESLLNITITSEGGRVIIKFEDNGLGIAPVHHQKIFDMFYKINEKSNGTGLGLHIVKINIEKLGGTIQLESKEGIGSTFTIIFRTDLEMAEKNATLV